MGRYEVWRLGEVGTPGFWLRQRAKRERALQRARFASRIRRWLGDTRSAAGAGWLLIVGSLSRIVLAVTTVAVLEYLCALARLSPLSLGNPLFAETAEQLQPLVFSLVGAAVAVAATLLGLYYTTVGVIASTIYKAVPGDVRDLFIRERASETYLKVVILTISGGVVVLVAGALGYQVAGLTLVALGILVALTCVGLVVVTCLQKRSVSWRRTQPPVTPRVSPGPWRSGPAAIAQEATGSRSGSRPVVRLLPWPRFGRQPS
ncbi:MAG: hypothetical protein WAQ75_09320 [Propionicimonas sp.]